MSDDTDDDMLSIIAVFNALYDEKLTIDPTSNDNRLSRYVVIINQYEFNSSSTYIAKISKTIEQYILDNPSMSFFDCVIEGIPKNFCYSSIDNIFLENSHIEFTRSNVNTIKLIAEELEIDMLIKKANDYLEYLTTVGDKLVNFPNFIQITNLQKSIFNLTIENFDSTLFDVSNQLNMIDYYICARLIFSACFTKHQQIDLFLNFLIKLNENLENEGRKPFITDFLLFLISLFKGNIHETEVIVIILKLTDYGYNFHKTNKHVNEFFAEKKITIQNIALYKAGINTCETAIALRNDNLDLLQKISSDPNFDFNGSITKCEYEFCKMANSCSYLEFAAYFGAIKCFKYLLMNCANISSLSMKYAVAGGNTEIVRLCEQTKHFGHSLDTAVIFHQNNIFDWLEETHQVKSLNYPKLLGLCVHFGNYEIMKRIVEKGVSCIAMFFEAAKFNDICIMKSCILIPLFDFQKAITTVSDKMTPLHYACFFENVEIVQLIMQNIENNPNSPEYILTKNSRGITSLHYACEKGNFAIVNLLFSKGWDLDVNVTDQYGITPLHLACRSGSLDIVKLLLSKKKIDVNKTVFINHFPLILF